MVVIYDSILTEPPSSVHCFRDVTLYSSVFLRFDNLIACPKGTRSMYWKWIKKYGAHDFVDALIVVDESQEGLTVGLGKKIHTKIINESNYDELINKLRKFSPLN